MRGSGIGAVDLAMRRESEGEKWRHYPPDVLPVWVADMDFEVAEPIRASLEEAIRRSDLGYPMDARRTGIAELFAQRMSDRFGWSPDPGGVELLTEVVQGIYVALLQLTEPGDGVIIQTPIYPPFLWAVEETGRRMVEAPLHARGGRYEIDRDELRSRCDDGTRVLLLCNPHNPTGRVFRRDELEDLAELAIERDLIVISDEIHADLVYPGAEHIPFASLAPEVSRRTVTLYSASKAFNIAGLRCAVASFGDPELKRRFTGLSQHVRGGLSLLGVRATRAAWEHGDPWLAEVLRVLQGNRDFALKQVRERFRGARAFAPEATYLAWIDCRGLGLEPSPFAFWLEHGKVAYADGAMFGAVGQGFVRLNFATSREILGEVLDRSARALDAA